MDNRFLKGDLTERYVLNQLNDEELANFRGQLMFDEALRKQVVETKMLMNGLATIAGKSAITNPSSASKVVQMPTSNNKIMLRAAMVIGVLMLAGLSYHFYNSSTTSTTASSSISEEPQENIETLIQVDEISTEEENPTESSTTDEVDEKKTEEAKETRVFASAKKTTPSRSVTKVEESPEEEMSFGEGLASVNNSTKSFFEKEDDNIGFVLEEEEVNEFIEDAITNSTTKSSIGIVKIKNFKNSDVLDRNKYNAVHLNFEGTIDTKASNNKKYVFKLFDNNKDAFINNNPLTQQHLKPLLLGKEQYDFKIEENIELEPGLYYFTIEEEVDNDQDMIYAGRFYVSAGKFFVK